MVLFFITSYAKHLGYAWNVLEMELDEPILDVPEFLQGVPPGLIFYIVEKDQAHTSGYRPHPGRAESIGDLLPGLLEALIDELTGEVYVHVVPEVDVHHRESEIRYGPHLLHSGQTVHGHLHRIGDVLLYLLRGQPLGLGEDLDQVRGDVWKCVHRKGAIAMDTRCRHQQSHEQDHQRIFRTESYDLAGHVSGPPRRAPFGVRTSG